MDHASGGKWGRLTAPPRLLLPRDRTVLHRAGLVHDIGLHGVPVTILDNPGPLSVTERERIRLSAYSTERVLVRPAKLGRIGAVLALAHERQDGSGYHTRNRRCRVPTTGRTLAASCAYRAMLEPRSHRPALTAKAAAGALHGEVRAGRLDTDAAHAVLTAAGVEGRQARRPGPAGLTPREVHRRRGRAPGDLPQDGGHPHRADPRQDRRVLPGYGDPVRVAQRAARPARSVGRTPDDTAVSRAYGPLIRS